ncbi:MAG: hypothetical protein JSS72_05555 [Armatimonadetes bacterium]|nr:hypothetical protein [Armatimonadota bacterium]
MPQDSRKVDLRPLFGAKLGRFRIWPFVLAILVTIGSYQYESLTFVPSSLMPGHASRLLVIKLCTVLLVSILGLSADWLIRNIRADNPLAKRWLRYGSFYFALNLILLLLTWPGTYRLDEFVITRLGLAYEFCYWQHYLTSLFYMASWNVIPLYSAPVIFQCLMASAVVGYLVAFYSLKQATRKWALLIFVPFLMLPTLDHNLYAMRTTPWTYLIIGLLAWLLTFERSTALNSRLKIVTLVILLAVIGAWRSEAVILMPAFLPFLLAYYWRQLSPKARWLIALGPIAGMQLLNLEQKQDPEIAAHRYEITSFVAPVAPLVVAHEHDPAAAKDMAQLARLFNFEPFRTKQGGEAFWNKGMREGFTQEDFIAGRNAFIHLAKMYPGLVLAERWDNFTASMGFHGFCHVRSTSLVFDPAPNSQLEPIMVLTISKLPSLQPFNKEFRRKVVSYLQMRYAADPRESTIGSIVLYNSAPAFIALLLALTFGLMRRQTLIVGGCISMLLCSLGIFITAPQSFFFYYYFVYIGGPILLILSWFEQMRKNQPEV